MSKLWLCGKFIQSTEYGIVWEFQGVFTNKVLAIKACRDKHYFIAPIYKNQEIDDKTLTFPECEYPIKE